MKLTTILGLMAAAVAALMAFAASASATTLTSPTGTVYTSTFKAVVDSNEKAVTPAFDGSFTTITACRSTIEGKIEQHGTGVTAGGAISKLTFENCNFPVTVLANGSLEIHPVRVNAKGEHETCLTTDGDTCRGTLTSTGAKLTMATSVGTCTFTTNGTNIGTLTTTAQTGKTATLDIGSSPIPRTEGNFLCGSSATWTGNYEVVTPDSLWVDE
jgi:hypothetical protein